MSKGNFLSIGQKNHPKTTEEFIEGAAFDGTLKSGADPKAPRSHKSIRLAFNEYEYQLLVAAADHDNRSLVAFVRAAWMEKAKRS